MLGRTRRRLSAVLSPTIVRRWRALLFWSEVLSRRLAHGFAAAAAGVKPRTRVLFYPSLPGLHMIALKLCLALGWGVTADPSKRADIVFHWNSSTFAEVDGTLESLASRHRVLNRECVDISKTNVNRVFAKAFGYTLGVDPRTHVGECVEKSDLNASHDGRIVMCPIVEPQEGAAYQRVVDNVRDDGRVMDIRVPIVGRTIPLAYLRFRPVDSRFRSGNEEAQIAQVHDALTGSEITDILRFCELLGLDYGELDVLRDRADGRIYVVDANPTPWGPPSGISSVDARRAITVLAAAFESEFLLGGARP